MLLTRSWRQPRLCAGNTIRWVSTLEQISHKPANGNTTLCGCSTAVMWSSSTGSKTRGTKTNWVRQETECATYLHIHNLPVSLSSSPFLNDELSGRSYVTPSKYDIAKLLLCCLMNARHSSCHFLSKIAPPSKLGQLLTNESARTQHTSRVISCLASEQPTRSVRKWEDVNLVAQHHDQSAADNITCSSHTRANHLTATLYVWRSLQSAKRSANFTAIYFTSLTIIQIGTGSQIHP